VDIGANPSAEGGDDHVVKVVDIVDTFHLQVAPSLCFSLFIVILVLFGNKHSCYLQEQPAFHKKQFPVCHEALHREPYYQAGC
jgi:hypothetical protein